jgi:hypothetical protein
MVAFVQHSGVSDTRKSTKHTKGLKSAFLWPLVFFMGFYSPFLPCSCA